MAVLSDFTVIVHDDEGRIVIGDQNAHADWVRTFGTGGRTTAGGPCYLLFQMRGMTLTNENARVFINDEAVGWLRNNRGGDPDHWSTQIVTFASNKLKRSGSNTLRITHVSRPQPTQNDRMDDFELKNVVCHFHQEG